MRKFSKRLSIVPAGLALGAALLAAAPHQTPKRAFPDLRCVPEERLACGCSLKIVTLTCSASDSANWPPHLFSDFHDGAPLWINVGGREVSLRSTTPATNSFTHGRGDSWREEYVGENLKVRIQYRPAKSTCPVEKGDEGCEYFDVAADVVVTVAGTGSRTYKALGVCGC